MPDRTIKLTLAYDGSCFAGWQVQASHRTVQGTIEAALGDLHGGPTGLTGAGRTDAGVHATGQVASYRSSSAIDAAKIADALNARLPRDIRILASEEASEGFDARRSARERLYRYYLYPARTGLPHLRRFCWRIPRAPDCGRLNAIAAALLGEQDFATFTAAGGSQKTTVRTVTRASFYPQGLFVVFEIAANAFLRKMVRSIVGTVLRLEADSADPAEMRDIIRSRERSRAGATAPARALFLERVSYHE